MGRRLDFTIAALLWTMLWFGCVGSMSIDDDTAGDDDTDDATIEYEITVSGVYTIIATSAGNWESGNYDIETW